MNYPRAANIVNIVFVLLIGVAPGVYCLVDRSVSFELGRNIIFLSLILSAFVISDWYHFYFTNSGAGLAITLLSGVGCAALILLLASKADLEAMYTLGLFRSVKAWEPMHWGLRYYVSALGFTATALVSIPRLLLIKLICKGNLPQF